MACFDHTPWMFALLLCPRFHLFVRDGVWSLPSLHVNSYALQSTYKYVSNKYPLLILRRREIIQDKKRTERARVCRRKSKVCHDRRSAIEPKSKERCWIIQTKTIMGEDPLWANNYFSWPLTPAPNPSTQVDIPLDHLARTLTDRLLRLSRVACPARTVKSGERCGTDRDFIFITPNPENKKST